MRRYNVGMGESPPIKRLPPWNGGYTVDLSKPLEPLRAKKAPSGFLSHNTNTFEVVPSPSGEAVVIPTRPEDLVANVQDRPLTESEEKLVVEHMGLAEEIARRFAPRDLDLRRAL